MSIFLSEKMFLKFLESNKGENRYYIRKLKMKMENDKEYEVFISCIPYLGE